VRRDDLSRSDVFCILPWIHLNVETDGRVLACCDASWDLPLGDLQVSTFQEVWNSEETRRLRLNMLEGKPSSACAQCYESQKARIPSAREANNKRFARHLPEVERTRPDGSLETMRMPYMDIRFSNVCNFRCRMCGPRASSDWFEDGTRLWGGLSHAKFLAPTKDPRELWRQIEPLLPHLEEIYFAGGEPLLQKEHYLILNFLLDRGLTDVRLRYSTNFSVMNHQGRDVMALWDKFRTVRVAASLDGMGRRGEYLRKGLVWEQVLRNRERMSKTCPRTEFGVSTRVNIMNSLHLPDFHTHLLETEFLEPGMFWFTPLRFPEEYRIQALPPEIKCRVAEKFERHAEKIIGLYGDAAKTEAELYRSALTIMAEEDRTDLLPRFRERTAKLDAMRGEKFSDVFPELAELTP
jgi:MoaA/NifB/PqqE/SkfB family radical SAM enzyme